MNVKKLSNSLSYKVFKAINSINIKRMRKANDLFHRPSRLFANDAYGQICGLTAVLLLAVIFLSPGLLRLLAVPRMNRRLAPSSNLSCKWLVWNKNAKCTDISDEFPGYSPLIYLADKTIAGWSSQRFATNLLPELIFNYYAPS